MIVLLSTFCLLAAVGLSLYGILGLITLWLYWRHRHVEFPLPELAPSKLPPVTVQLPIYNERYVVDRLINAAVSLDYPRDRLQIQVLDDSTDDTTQRAGMLVERYRDVGVDISLLHRSHRQGYKAGALSEALAQAQGEYLVIFDADFQPPADFLRQTMPHFKTEPRLGMVQARWGHLNSYDSPVTAAQAIALDKHFVMEQTVRHRANLFPRFNGAGGIWRRACLTDAGGWQVDTVCEDLCADVIAPAELPATISAYKNQQARWAKGSAQCLLKHGKAIALDQRQSVFARVYALLSMSAYATHFLLLALLLVQVPLLHTGFQFPSGLWLITLAGLGQPLLFVLGQQVLYADWRKRLRHFPIMLLMAIGIAPSNTRAMGQAIVGRHHPFIRTPKGEAKRRNGKSPTNDDYRLPFDWIIGVEVLLSVYAGVGLVIALKQNTMAPLFFLICCLAGFSFVAILGLGDTLRR
jgi:cellulose synthase/poly-beta-1,6-N-acetylglucosamine synthase-like glycosyltransferase